MKWPRCGASEKWGIGLVCTRRPGDVLPEIEACRLCSLWQAHRSSGSTVRRQEPRHESRASRSHRLQEGCELTDLQVGRDRFATPIEGPVAHRFVTPAWPA